jgi:hypothetical protein
LITEIVELQYQEKFPTEKCQSKAKEDIEDKEKSKIERMIGNGDIEEFQRKLKEESRKEKEKLRKA